MGPLQGIKILEFAGIGPGRFAAMMLSDLGADILRLDRTDRVKSGDKSRPSPDILNRGRLRTPDCFRDPLYPLFSLYPTWPRM